MGLGNRESQISNQEPNIPVGHGDCDHFTWTSESQCQLTFCPCLAAKKTISHFGTRKLFLRKQKLFLSSIINFFNLRPLDLEPSIKFTLFFRNHFGLERIGAESV